MLSLRGARSTTGDDPGWARLAGRLNDVVLDVRRARSAGRLNDDGVRTGITVSAEEAIGILSAFNARGRSEVWFTDGASGAHHRAVSEGPGAVPTVAAIRQGERLACHTCPHMSSSSV